MNAPVVAGDVIAEQYRVDQVLGSGGAGTLIAASHLARGQRVALRLLPGDCTPARAERFLRDARAAMQLGSEHVARVLDVGQLGSGVPYAVTEYLEGRDLSALLRERSPLELHEALDVVLQACVALAEAHAAGIVHGALEPASLFLTTAPGGATLVKVLDLGLANEPPGARGGDATARPEGGLGAPLYMAPEQVRPSEPVDARADIWSLGAILYRLLTGQPPFEASSLADLALRVAGAEPALPSALRPDIPPAVERTLLGCLAKDRARRPANVAELALALAPHAPASGQERAQRIARLLGATLPPRTRGSLPTIGLGLGLDGRPRVAPPQRPRDGAGQGAPASSRAPEQGAPGRGRSATRLALIAAIASLIALLGVVAVRSGAGGEPPPGERPGQAASPEATAR
ncbi:serine/threonine-protein kinase [Sorangium sp. So ce513]|uniref:serine/threonine-protein kinase n=1 Tax=Sorangium sp. So ce513 TaxID=3133315 RepID=UPI003F5FE252